MASLNSVIRYFDLNSHLPSKPTPHGGGGSDRQLHWLPQYLALFAGVLIEPAFSNFRSTGAWSFVSAGSWTAFAVITSFLVFPSVYRRAFDAEKPLIVLLAPIFTAGLGWESLVGTVLKGASTALGK